VWRERTPQHNPETWLSAPTRPRPWQLAKERVCFTAAAAATMALISKISSFAALENMTVSASAIRIAFPLAANPLGVVWRRTKREANAAKWHAFVVIGDLSRPPRSAHKRSRFCAVSRKLQSTIPTFSNGMNRNEFWRFSNWYIFHFCRFHCLVTFYSVSSLPPSEEYMPEIVCAYFFVQCFPTIGICVPAQECKALDALTKGEAMER
jgi:hypothetical protein